MNQNDIQRVMVADHLNRVGSITPREAQIRYSVARLAAVIFTLRKSGMKIRTDTQYGKNQFGKPCHWAVYVKENENEQG